MLEPFLAHFSKHTSFGSYLGVIFGDKCQKNKTSMLCDREKLLVFLKAKNHIHMVWLFKYIAGLSFPDEVVIELYRGLMANFTLCRLYSQIVL